MVAGQRFAHVCHEKNNLLRDSTWSIASMHASLHCHSSSAWHSILFTSEGGAAWSTWDRSVDMNGTHAIIMLEFAMFSFSLLERCGMSNGVVFWMIWEAVFGILEALGDTFGGLGRSLGTFFGIWTAPWDTFSDLGGSLGPKVVPGSILGGFWEGFWLHFGGHFRKNLTCLGVVFTLFSERHFFRIFMHFGAHVHDF